MPSFESTGVAAFNNMIATMQPKEHNPTLIQRCCWRKDKINNEFIINVWCFLINFDIIKTSMLKYL